MPLTALCFWLVYVSGVGAALLSPLMGVLLYVLVYHLNPEAQWWGESIRTLGLRMSLTIVLATIVGIVLRRPSFGRLGRQFVQPLPIVLLFVVVAIASLGFGYGLSERGLHQAEKLAKIAVFLMILIRCVREPAHYHLLVLAWLAGVLYIGHQAWSNMGIRSDGRLSYGLGGSDFNESGDLAAHLVATIPFVAAAFFQSRTMLGRGLILFTGALAVNTIIMTRTRGALLGLAAMAVVMVLSLPRNYRLKGWIATLAGIALAVQLTDPGWWDRMARISTTPTDASATGRITYWIAAIEMVRDYPMGIGLGNFHTAVQDYVPGLNIVRSAHNTFLECLAEIGFVGVGLLLCVIVVALTQVSIVRKRAVRYALDRSVTVFGRDVRFHLCWHATALRASIVGYLVCALFQSRVAGEDFWILLTMSACLHNVSTHMQHTRSFSSRSLLPNVRLAQLGGA